MHSRAAVLLAWLRAGSPPEPRADGPLGEVLRDAVARCLLADVRLGGVVSALGRCGIEPLLLKGAALSHGVYPLPWLRPRGDDDLLVPREQFTIAMRAIEALGYTPLVDNPGWEQTGQAHLTRSFRDGSRHDVDLHWRPVIPAAFADLPGYAAMRAAARRLEPIDPAAWQPSAAHALLIACAHRVAHHAPADDPIWLVDVHLLASGLGDEDWDALARSAIDARVAGVCRYELARASRGLGTDVPPRVRHRLAGVAGERSERHVRARSRLHRLWLDAADSRGRRWRVIAERVWPPRSYMRVRYGRAATRLGLAYFWRAGAGAVSWLAEAARRSWSH
jgi:hypothetical protein